MSVDKTKHSHAVFLLMGSLFVLGVGGLILGAHIDEYRDMVANARRGLLVMVSSFLVIGVSSYRYANVWAVSMVRMLITGLLAYVCISQIVDLGGSTWGDWAQVVTGGGIEETDARIQAVRYALVAWSLGLALMMAALAIRFEDCDTN